MVFFRCFGSICTMAWYFFIFGIGSTSLKKIQKSKNLEIGNVAYPHLFLAIRLDRIAKRKNNRLRKLGGYST